MKTLKKVLAITLALAMVFSFAVTAFAADANKITIYNDNAGHTYEAYQIFAGDLYDGVLSNVTWGSGVDTSKLDEGEKLTIGSESLTAAEWAEKLNASAVSAADFADAVAAVLKDTPTAQTNQQKDNLGEGGDKKGYEINVSNPGYYLVKDKDDSVAGQDAYTKFILKVVGDAEATAKSDYPDVEKDVLDNNDSNSADPTNNWGKSADHDINDEVEFRLTGTIPNMTGYKTYYYAFHDTMDKTLELVENSFKVTVGGIEITAQDYTLEIGADKHSFDLIIKDLISLIEKVKDQPGYDANKGVVVTYKAKLTEDAVIGMPGQENSVDLEFSNNPNWKGKGKGEPKEPGEPEEPTGKTPKKTVVVFTYEADVNKTDEKGDELSGAKFTLEKFVEDENGTLDEKTGKKGSWVAVKETTATPGSTFEFKGLDDGYYRLTETEAPAGYNKLTDPIYFTVSAEHDMSPKSLTVTVDNKDFEVEGGKLSTDVKNNKGVELPETGGIGTTIFYVVGGLIVLAAAVLLITKRRMKDVD